MMIKPNGFLELEHTADWAIKVWAPSIELLLITAAEGIYALTKVKTISGKSLKKTITIDFSDYENLIVDFLSELLFWGEIYNLAALKYHLTLQEGRLSGEILVEEIRSREKEIKAVTYHNLQVLRSTEGFNTIITFDV